MRKIRGTWPKPIFIVRAYPHRTKRFRYCRVYVFRTVRDKFRFVALRFPRDGYLTHRDWWGLTRTVFHEADDGCFAEVFMNVNALSVEVIAHEMDHAAFIYCALEGTIPGSSAISPWHVLHRTVRQADDEESHAYAVGCMANDIAAAVFRHHVILRFFARDKTQGRQTRRRRAKGRKR